MENGDIIMLIIKISHNFPLEHFIFIHVIINFFGPQVQKYHSSGQCLRAEHFFFLLILLSPFLRPTLMCVPILICVLPLYVLF